MDKAQYHESGTYYVHLPTEYTRVRNIRSLKDMCIQKLDNDIPWYIQSNIPLLQLNTNGTGVIAALSAVQGERCALWAKKHDFLCGLYHGWCVESIQGGVFTLTLGGHMLAENVSYYDLPFFPNESGLNNFFVKSKEPVKIVFRRLSQRAYVPHEDGVHLCTPNVCYFPYSAWPTSLITSYT